METSLHYFGDILLANYLIGLREGLEATLVVSILIAYLVKTDNHDRLWAIWLGIATAIGLSIGFGALLSYGSSQMSFEAQEAFGGALSIVAVGFVTWMVFWMRRMARLMKTELHGKLDAALAIGAGALAVTSFIAVGREGLETSLFMWTAVQATGQTAQPLIGAALGIASAIVLGWLLYKRAVNIKLQKFFTITGAALIVVAAGVLSYGFHDLQEAGILPGLNAIAFDVSDVVPPSSWYGTLLKGIFNFSAASTWIEVAVWWLYLLPTMCLFLIPLLKARPQSQSSAQPLAQPVAQPLAQTGTSNTSAPTSLTTEIS